MSQKEQVHQQQDGDEGLNTGTHGWRNVSVVLSRTASTRSESEFGEIESLEDLVVDRGL